MAATVKCFSETSADYFAREINPHHVARRVEL